ncbi:FG-GAP repeat domain-containing protein [Ningiella sp. W23]|uniref:FG-GAP repeat domain-containing protein n=1 Tax=Ningiella sp. W23 TaxID=3023715 RepID=UPI003757632C
MCAFALTACQPAANNEAEAISESEAAPDMAMNTKEQVAKSVSTASAMPALDWQYIQVDDSKQMWGDWAEPEWLRYFGLAAGDVNGDGLMDILSGRYVYLQKNSATGVPASQWQRLDLGDNVDGILIIDADGDDKLDIIAQALPQLYWYEMNDEGGFTRTNIGEVPATTHVNSQGFTVANIVGDQRNEFIIAGNGNLFAFKAHSNDDGSVRWQKQLVAANTSDEGIGVGDIDGDGDIDLAAGRRPEGDPEPKEVLWYENPGNMDGQWQSHYVGKGSHPIDRVEIADLNGDGLGDIVFTEERYPGLEPDAQMVKFVQTSDGAWEREVLVTQFSMNNLDIGDVDQDGDLDLITAEHKGEVLETELWQNDGNGNFTQSVIDTGKESHLGTQLVDIDGDGDLDIISAGWDQHQFVHIWLNPAISNISISEVEHLERAHFLVKTPSASYLLDRAGGGFSSIIDVRGNDWVNFKMQPWGDYPAAAAGAFRGIPNAIHDPNNDRGQKADSGAGHPGFDTMQTSQVDEKRVVSTSASGNWQWQYSFYPQGVKMQILKAPADVPYWFLYEGTPGGVYDLSQSTYGTNTLGFQSDTPDFYQGSVKEGEFDWAYFSHSSVEQSLYLAQLTDDNAPDVMSYLGNTQAGANSPDGMVVFGFGRDGSGAPGLIGKQSFLFGLAPLGVSDTQAHEDITRFINQQVSYYSTES